MPPHLSPSAAFRPRNEGAIESGRAGACGACPPRCRVLPVTLLTVARQSEGRRSVSASAIDAEGPSPRPLRGDARVAAAELSCVVMSCGNEPGLERAVLSLLEQDEPVEVVVVNSAGGGARRRLERRFSSVRVWETEERLNPGAARNLGVGMTSAPYVAFLAADCVARPGWAARRLDRHRAGAAGVASALENAAPGSAVADASFLLLFRTRMPSAGPERRLYGLSYRRSVLERVGPFREDMRTGEDSDLNERLGDERIDWAPEVITAHPHPRVPATMLVDHFLRGRRAALARRQLFRSRARTHAAAAALRNAAASATAARELEAGARYRRATAAWARAGGVAYALGSLTTRGAPLRDRLGARAAQIAMPSAGPSLAARRVRLLAVLPVRDEIDELPGCLESLAAHTDGVVALDDGSTDGSAEWLAARREVLELIRIPADRPRWDEPRNRRLLVEAACRHGAEWIIALDADERLELHFRERAERVIARGRRLRFDAYAVRIRELWDDSETYRADGVWGRKAGSRLFRARRDHDHDARELHGYKGPLQTLRRLGAFPRADLEIHHRGMLRAADRLARRERYEGLDPEARWQPRHGYAYLTDESGLELRRLDPERGWRGWWRSERPAVRRLLLRWTRKPSRRLRRRVALKRKRARRVMRRRTARARGALRRRLRVSAAGPCRRRRVPRGRAGQAGE